MKKGFLFIIALVFAFFAFCGFYAKADSVTITMVNGAQVRTEGEYQGLRFQASVNTLEGASEHGFYLAIGEHTLSDMETAIEAGADNVGGYKLVKKNALGSETTFAITIYGIASDHYLDDVTAVAFVKVGDDYILDKVVTRNITEVAFEAVSNGDTGTILDNVTEAAKANYMVKSGSLNVFNEYTVTELQNVKYGFNNLSALYAEFLSDYNAATGASLTASSTAAQLAASMYAGMASDTEKDLSHSNAAKFFDGANFTKWKWILEYFSTEGTNVHVKNQASALLRIDRTCQAAKYDGWRARHLSCAIYNFFNTASFSLVYGEDSFTGEESYSKVTWPAVTSFNDENVVKVGDAITLPAAPTKIGYTYTKYNDGTSDYAPGDSYTITASKATIKSVFTAITYSISYVTNDGTNHASNPTEYTIETDTITLQNPTKDGKIFNGWFEEIDFSGDVVTTIAKGTHGNITLYAKWVDPAPEALPVTSNDVTILNTVTPNIIVKSDLSGRYYLSGEGLNASYADEDHYYTYNTNAFLTIAEAVAAAKANDTIYVFAGTYSDALTISKAGISIYGANPTLVLDHAGSYTPTATDKTNIDAVITVSANDFVLNNVVLSGQVSISNGVSGVTLKKIISNSSSDGPIFVDQSRSVTNLTIDEMIVVKGCNRVVYVHGTVTNLSINKLYVLDSLRDKVCDVIRIGNGSNVGRVSGTVSVTNCYLTSYQSGYMDRVPAATNYIIEHNYFYNIPVAIYFRGATISTAMTYNINYNTIYKCGKPASDWDVMNITNSSTTTTNMHYNVFVDSNYGVSGSNKDYIIMIRTASVGTFDLADNYFYQTSNGSTSDFGATYCIKNAPSSGSLTLWSLESPTTTANTYDNYQVVEIGGHYYIYGINLTTN